MCIRDSNYKIPLIYANESKLFLDKLKGVTSPEKKRKIIGNLFIKVFQKHAKKMDNIKFLAQGTLYPDVIESVSVNDGPSVTIKSHHNVGGLPKKMGLKLIEPLRSLFKDEVRNLGNESIYFNKQTKRLLQNYRSAYVQLAFTYYVDYQNQLKKTLKS